MSPSNRIAAMGSQHCGRSYNPATPFKHSRSIICTSNKSGSDASCITAACITATIFSEPSRSLRASRLLRRLSELEVGELPGRHLILLRLCEQTDHTVLGRASERGDALIVGIEGHVLALHGDAQRVGGAIAGLQRIDLARRACEQRAALGVAD